ncbi:MAG: redoxin domain-containing protein [Cyclobacteriaceae bacterium]|jgi:hypothetical protein|nr:redoxin domain-containing protein [Cyclobacteriaceae bacterium]
MKPAFLFVWWLATLAAHAQTTVTNFRLPNVADGKTVSLDGYPECVALAVVFTGNECAFDQYYTDRLRELITTYQGKIQFLLVNSYLEATELPDRMLARYRQWNLPVPYLADKEQVAMDCLGARKTPEVFLIRNDAKKLTLAYRGAIDDSPQMAKAVREAYLKDAIEKVLKGDTRPMATQRPMGCTIR